MVPRRVYDLPSTQLTVQAYPLSHANLQSIAFLIGIHGKFILYLGDTGEDSLEKSHDLHSLWEVVAPLIISKKLRAIFIETSFADDQPDRLLFGHLTPRLLMKEMGDLARLTGPDNLKGFNIIITHRKPPLDKVNAIKNQLEMENQLKLHLVFPTQGEALDL